MESRNEHTTLKIKILEEFERRKQKPNELDTMAIGQDEQKNETRRKNHKRDRNINAKMLPIKCFQCDKPGP
ncbi:hypothetical protein K0M31_008800 [Melipona bicolor]|uniref:Uncharacterized protein n=1 Tax=Melipona bicolor TaxID=60889 RepID=A0AA40KKA5_9HYME|nr:hypothetical protein K0M31_008800 [Melipona bicolor]